MIKEADAAVAHPELAVFSDKLFGESLTAQKAGKTCAGELLHTAPQPRLPPTAET